jgi:hypothetical protein
MAVAARQPNGRNGSTPADQAGLPVRQIHPALKAWLDNVLIPILVREYLSTEGATSDDGLGVMLDVSEPIQ